MVFSLKKLLGKISKALLGKEVDEIHNDPVIISSSKYAPMTSVNVE